MNASGFLRRGWRWVKWPLAALAVAYIAISIWGATLVFDRDKTDAAVAQIHAQKLTLADVEGKNLPPVPDQAENDVTVAGLDKNNNGIRDDVELAIFKKYPNSAKIRAAELQYAMAEQMYLTKVFNEGTWKAVAEENSRASSCFGQLIPDRNLKKYLEYTREVKSLVFNTQQRKDAEDNSDKFTTSYGSAPGSPCDVDLTTL